MCLTPSPLQGKEKKEETQHEEALSSAKGTLQDEEERLLSLEEELALLRRGAKVLSYEPYSKRPCTNGTSN